VFDVYFNGGLRAKWRIPDRVGPYSKSIFSNLKPGDVKVDGKQVHLRLPPPQIFSTRIDSAKTRVYSRQTGLLVPTDPDLETQVRQEAERQLKEAAMADGILRNAQQNAASTILSLLQGLGFEKIEFD